MWVLNTLKVSGREYSEKDIKRIESPDKFGVDRFYGGKINVVGVTDTDVLLLIDQNMKVFDTMVESLENVDTKIIKGLADKRKLKYNLWTSKDNLIRMLSGETVKDEPPESKKSGREKNKPGRKSKKLA